ncbi:MAG TPA: isoprenylcysteine carboxylmethyltransferase family protein, partial [Rhizomicrobium sp.]
YDPALLKERIGPSGQKRSIADRILMPLLGVVYCAWLVFMALDVRWHGFSQMPEWLNYAAGAAILASFAGMVRVFRENSFASSVVRVQKDRGQTVITTGPYAIVRHPMYSIASFTYLVIPFALGSWMGLLAVPLLILGLAIRALVEERVLKEQLESYGDYMAKVRYRFMPYVW